MKLTVQGGEKKTVGASDAVFAGKYNEALVHQAVTAYLAGARAGSKAQKTRAMVNGGGKKPWRQKGTGRARAGSIRSPLWRGGGVIHAAAPRDHSVKLNRKMYRGALRSIFSELARTERLLVVEKLELEEPKTKALIAELERVEAGQDALVVVEEMTEALALSARNLPGVAVCGVSELDPVALVAFEKVVLSVDALKRIEGWLG
ncbi:MAG: 50S ribosomal protein L4 [Gammaproteobacteria bacterium]|nr:50S ribosomal protein L4 [Gammaproteobacteria bacterium]